MRRCTGLMRQVVRISSGPSRASPKSKTSLRAILIVMFFHAYFTIRNHQHLSPSNPCHWIVINSLEGKTPSTHFKAQEMAIPLYWNRDSITGIASTFILKRDKPCFHTSRNPHISGILSFPSSRQPIRYRLPRLLLHLHPARRSTALPSSIYHTVSVAILIAHQQRPTSSSLSGRPTEPTSPCARLAVTDANNLPQLSTRRNRNGVVVWVPDWGCEGNGSHAVKHGECRPELHLR